MKDTKHIIFEIPADIPQGKYKLAFQPVEDSGTDVIIADPDEEIPDSPGTGDYESPETSLEPSFPQVQDVVMLRPNDRTNANTATYFKYKGVEYVLCYNDQNRKNELHVFENNEITHILNLDVMVGNEEVYGYVQSIVHDENEYYALVSIEKVLHLMKYRKGTSLKVWDVLGEIKIDGAKDAQHNFFINKRGNFQLMGRLRGPQDWPEAGPIRTDSRGIRVHEYGDTAESMLFTLQSAWKIDPIELQPDYLTAKIRRGLYGSVSIVLNGKTYTFVNTYFQNEDYKPLKRPERWDVGTGPLYPCIIRDYGTVTAWDKHLIDQTPFLKDWKSEESLPFNPQIGQLYMNSVVDMGDYLRVFFVERDDPHYVDRDDQKPTKAWTGTLNKQALIDWFDWKEKQ